VFDLERPFNRLVHHFVVRIFYGAGEGDDLQFSIPALLGLLSVPSAFGAIQLLGKYSTLRLFLMGLNPLDVYRASIPDEYFFIVYSMVVTGSVVILKWDRLFPDRQDYDNLAILPLSARQNFVASLTALLLLAALFAAIINGAASVLFPLAVTASFNRFAIFVEFFVAHSVSVLSASFFACFGLLLLMGVTILVTPRRYIRAVSLAVRILCALGLIGVLSTVFTMPRFLSSGHIPAYAPFVPPVWFLDLHQMLLSRGTQHLGLGAFCLEIAAATIVLSLVVYAVTYYREYIQIPERGGLSGGRRRDSYSWIRRVVDAMAVRLPFQQATYHFAFKTLFRSERHCLLFGTACAIAFFLAGQTAAEALANPIRQGIDPRVLSISLTMVYFAIISLRALFDLPTDRHANWIFRSTVNLYKDSGRDVAARILLSIAVGLMLIGLPLHVALWGWATALLHTAYVLVCARALVQLLLLRFHKIPFACTYTASKDRVLVMVFLSLIGYSFFSGTNSSLEASLLQEPIHFLIAAAFFIALFWAVRFYREGLPVEDRILVFEDRPRPVVQRLDLSQ
jgi:hypothetical protein